MSSGNTPRENPPLIQIIVALIGAGAAIIVGYWQYSHKDESTNFVGRVKNIKTEKDIRGAKISLEVQGVPPVMYTDSDGIFYFPLKNSSTAIRIRVEADGYEKFDRVITPSAKSGIEEIRLIPVQPQSESTINESTIVTQPTTFPTEQLLPSPTPALTANNPVTIPKTVISPTVSPPLNSAKTRPNQSNDGVRFELKACGSENETLKCEFLVRDKTQNRNLCIYGKYINTSRLIDPQGTEYIAKRVDFGSKNNRAYVCQPLVQDIDLTAFITFENVPTSIDRLALVEIVVKLPNQGFSTIRFRDIAVLN